MGNEEYREKAPQDAGQPARRAGLRQAGRLLEILRFFMPGDGFYLNKVILFLERRRDGWDSGAHQCYTRQLRVDV